MSLYKYYQIEMASNTSPSPFEIKPLYNETLYNSPHEDFYKLFDKSNDSYFKIAPEKRISFNIILDDYIYLSKVIINYKSDDCFIESGSIYGINDDGTSELLVNNISSTSSSLISDLEIIIKNNINKYNKYGINITISSGKDYFYIYEIEFYSNIKKLVFNNNLYYGYDEDKTILSFDDINSYNKYYFLIQNLNNDMTILDDKYPFKIIKLG